MWTWALCAAVALIVAADVAPVRAQSAVVRGFVTAASDGEPLQGVNVILDDTSAALHGNVTNADGFFLIPRVPPGRYVLRASFVGFQTYVDTLVLAADDNVLLNMALSTDAVTMGEVAVEAERESGAARVTAGVQTVRPQDIDMIPAPDISADLVSYLSAVPGVVLMGDRGGQIFVRGGEPSHNLTLLDGMDVYQPFHILGFYSAFPADIINRADIHAGAFSSRYSGRLSSVIDVQTRNGNKRTFSAGASASPFTSSARVEGPLVRDHVSFLSTARVSQVDRLAAEYVDAPLPYVFNDAIGKIHMGYGAHQVSVTGLYTYDRGRLAAEGDLFPLSDEIRWTNRALGVRYLVAPRALPILGELLVSYSELESELGSTFGSPRRSRISSVNTAINVTNYGRYAEVDWGFFFRTPTLETDLAGLFQNLDSGRQNPPHAGTYLEPEFYVGRGLYVRPGLNVQFFGGAGGVVEPRLRLRWERGLHHWSAAAGIYHQQMVGLNDRRDATNIFTAWVTAPFGEIARASHLLLGYRVTPVSWMEVSVEGFYKELYELFATEWTTFPRFTLNLQRAHGRAAGFDVRVEIRRRHFYGFANYGYSSTRYDTDPESEVAFDPGPYRPPHDRRHQVNAVMGARPYGFDVSVRWQFGSGMPYTPIEGFDGFILMDGDVDVRSVRGLPRVIYERVPYRAELPTYHRLDVSVERTFSMTRWAEVTLQGGVLNVYDRTNLFALDLFTARRTDQLPFVPFAGLKVDL